MITIGEIKSGNYSAPNLADIKKSIIIQYLN